MAESISWKDFERHLDNIIPGVILSSEWIALNLKTPTALHDLPPFMQSAVFVAVSYAIGLLSAMVSRNLLDTVSENGLRAVVFERFVHGKRPALVKYYDKRDPKFKADRASEDKRFGGWIADWNSVYRSALRLSTRPDVDRRRAQGRLVRNLFFPTILGGLLFASAVSLSAWVGAISGGLLICYLYAYAELNNMQEAHDISAVEPADVRLPQGEVKVSGTNGGSLSKISCFSAILEALSPRLPKLLMSTVCCVYSDDSDTRTFVQVRFPNRGLCFRKNP